MTAQKVKREPASGQKRRERVRLGFIGGLSVAVALALAGARFYRAAASVLWIGQRVNRRHHWIPHCLGMIFTAKGKYDRAEASFEAALNLDRDSVPSWFALGVAQVSGGRANDAMRTVKQLRRLDIDAAADLAARVTYPDTTCLACNNFRDTDGSPITCRLYKDGTVKITRSGGRILLRAIAADGGTIVRHATPTNAKWASPPWAQ